MVGFGCCVGSWDRFARYVLPFAGDRPVLGLSGQTSIADTYNRILDSYTESKVRMLILQHDDLEITDPDAIAKFIAAFDDQDVVLAGVAGGGSAQGLAWWNVDPVGHQRIDTMNIDFGSREGVVDLLEGSILVFSRWAITNLRFVPRPGFHGYDEIAMHARDYDDEDKCVVIDVDTHHHTTLGFDNEASHQEWLESDRWFRQRWGIK